MISNKLSELDNDDTSWEVLAFLRFVLAMMVALGHFAIFIKPDRYQLVGDGYFNPLSAVYGFLVLSGYSIAASLHRERTNFYMRRFIRIWPQYLTCVIFGLWVDKYFSTGIHWPRGQNFDPSTSNAIIGSFCMLQTFWQGPIAILGTHWTLAVEWWFYMIAPLFKRNFKVLLTFACTSLLYYLCIHHQNLNIRSVEGWPSSMHGSASLGLAWLWIIGYIYYYFPKTHGGIALLILPALFAATTGRSTGVPYFLTSVVLAYYYDCSLLKKYTRICNFLGDISYPIYLLHLPIMALMVAFGYQNRSFVTLTVLLASTISVYLVDYPSRRIFKHMITKNDPMS